MTAGWMAAAVYLLCILAPGAALALGHGPAPCLSDPARPAAVMLMHQAAADMHGDGSAHEHAAMHGQHHADASDAPPAHHHGGNTHDNKTHDNKTHDNKTHDQTSPGPCCAMMCVTALPADLPLMVKPSQPTSLCAAEIELMAPGKAPPLLYRPPIA